MVVILFFYFFLSYCNFYHFIYICEEVEIENLLEFKLPDFYIKDYSYQRKSLSGKRIQLHFPFVFDVRMYVCRMMNETFRKIFKYEMI